MQERHGRRPTCAEHLDRRRLLWRVEFDCGAYGIVDCLNALTCDAGGRRFESRHPHLAVTGGLTMRSKIRSL